jgi:glycosyltransferase involved in cell wall biosynthesis
MGRASDLAPAHDARPDGRLRVVMAGPLPPVIGGMTSVIENLAGSALARHAELVLFDTAKDTPDGRPLWLGIRSKLAQWARWFRAVGGRGTVAHIHTCSGLSFFLDGVLVLLARLRGTPVVLHIHGARFDDFLGALNAAGRWAVRRLALASDCVIVLSDEWLARLQPYLGGARLAVLENGVGMPAVRERVPDPARPVDILFLGNLGRRKGVWDLLDAADSVGGSYRLLLVGGDELPGATAEASAAIRERGLGDRVIVVGPLRGAAKDRQLAAADVFVLPSHAEGLPVAMLEAMAAGLPVVVTPVGAIPSIIDDGRNGLLVPPGQPAELATALTRLVADPALRRRLGAAARVDCERRFGIESIAERLLGIYQRIGARDRGETAVPARLPAGH